MSSARQTEFDGQAHLHSNRMQLSGRQWAVVAGLVFPLVALVPVAWKKIEWMERSPDYRVPYELSHDYWLYQRHLQRASADDDRAVFVLGDSVVWGEYVRRDATLSHFLTRRSNGDRQFVNAGLNGLFPLALEGLARHYGGPLRHRKVILHCNLLWMSSPEADLSVDKEQKFNHVQLVPQIRPWIPCYRADLDQRTSIIVRRASTFLSWNSHLQICYYDGHSIPVWTLADDGQQPPRSIHALSPPWSPITLRVPTEPLDDEQRGPDSQRHRPWSQRGISLQSFDWVAADRSLQWAAFQRLVRLLQQRGGDVLVVIGPFNEHLVQPSDRAGLALWNATVAGWLAAQQVPYVAPGVLPSDAYADASHPLSDGYAELAERLHADTGFTAWLAR
jgi:hypothetical protein